MANFNSILDKLNEDYQYAKNNGTGEAYSRLSTIFEELGGYLREYMQDLTENQIRVVLRKLRDGNELAPEDIDMLRLWIVDDAQRYIDKENNFDDWQQETARLIDELARYRDQEADVKVVSEMRALFRDGSRVITDIFYYLQQKDRVENFEQASQALGPQERSLLIGLLEQKIKIGEF